MTAVEFLLEKWSIQGTLHSSDIAQAKEMEEEQRMYSEEEVTQLLIKFNQEIQEVENVREWFEQFKKK